MFHLFAAIVGIKSHKSIYLSQNKSYGIPVGGFPTQSLSNLGADAPAAGRGGLCLPKCAPVCSRWLITVLLVDHLPFCILQTRQQV